MDVAITGISYTAFISPPPAYIAPIRVWMEADVHVSVWGGPHRESLDCEEEALGRKPEALSQESCKQGHKERFRPQLEHTKGFQLLYPGQDPPINLVFVGDSRRSDRFLYCVVPHSSRVG